MPRVKTSAPTDLGNPTGQARRLSPYYVRAAAAFGFLAVLLGAFGAHGLKEILAQNGTAAIWEKAVFYHFIHAAMLFVLASAKNFRALAWWSFLVGIVIFSGSLYLLAITNERWLGAVTPLGGIAFLVGWGCLAFCPKANAPE